MLTTITSMPQIPTFSPARQQAAAPTDRFLSTPPQETFPTRAQLLRLMRPTPSDVEGPYYRENAPVRTELFAAGEPGNKVEYQMQVVDTSGKAIPGAQVDVWTADHTGVYDMESPEFRGRARLTGDEEGNTAFTALRPGNYELDKGVFRPAHVHVKVSAPGHKPVLSQLYFPDDPYNRIDPIEDRDGEGPEAGWDPALEMTNSGQDNVFSYKFVLAQA